jgi:hypothetical protein
MRWAKRNHKRLDQWHKWFAWYPVTIGNIHIWLTIVERKGTWCLQDAGGSFWYGFDWEYREKEIKNKTKG